MLLVLMLLLGLLPVSVFALDERQTELAERYKFSEQSLEQIITQFRNQYGLTAENFSLSYYATGTAETYHLQEHTYRTAGSMYKLALNMYYYDLERAGEIDPEMTIQEHRKDENASEEPLKEWSLADMHHDTIVYSDNDMAIAMLYNLGTFYEYRKLMTKYSDQEYAPEYYWDNVINTNYMLDVLKYLYKNQKMYPELMENLTRAAPWMFFKQYVDHPIAHKYGLFEGAYCDAGIIFSEEPFFLVAMLQLPYEEETEGEEDVLPEEDSLPVEEEIDGPEVIARVAELLSAYTDYRAGQRETPLQVVKPALPQKPKTPSAKPLFREVCHK